MFTEILVLCMHCLYSVICHQYGTNSWVSLMCNVLESTTLTTISSRVLEGAVQNSTVGYTSVYYRVHYSVAECPGSARLVSDSQRIFLSIIPATAYQDICLPCPTALHFSLHFLFPQIRPKHRYLYANSSHCLSGYLLLIPLPTICFQG